MKMRAGFVSNSSSSSFILAVKADAIDDVYEQMRQHAELFNYDEKLPYENVYVRTDVEDVIAIVKQYIAANRQRLLRYPNDEGSEYGTSLMEDIDVELKNYEERLSDCILGEDTWNSKEVLKVIINLLYYARASGLNTLFKLEVGNDGWLDGLLGDVLDEHACEIVKKDTIVKFGISNR